MYIRITRILKSLLNEKVIDWGTGCKKAMPGKEVGKGVRSRGLIRYNEGNNRAISLYCECN